MFSPLLLAVLLSAASSIPLPSHVPQECKEEVKSKFAQQLRLSPGEAHKTIMKKVLAEIDLSKCSNVPIRYKFADGEEDILNVKKEDEFDTTRKRTRRTKRKKNLQTNTKLSQTDEVDSESNKNTNVYESEKNKNVRRNAEVNSRLRKNRGKNGPQQRARRRRTKRPQKMSDAQTNSKPGNSFEQHFRKKNGDLPNYSISNIKSENKKIKRLHNFNNPNIKITNNYEDTYQDVSQVNYDYRDQNNDDRYNYYQENTRPRKQKRKGNKIPNIRKPQNGYPNTWQPENNSYSPNYDYPNNQQDDTRYGTTVDYQNGEQENIDKMETTSLADKEEISDDEKNTTILQNTKKLKKSDDNSNDTTLSDVELPINNDQLSTSTITTRSNKNDAIDINVTTAKSYETTTDTTLSDVELPINNDQLSTSPITTKSNKNDANDINVTTAKSYETTTGTTIVSLKSTTFAISDENILSPIVTEKNMNSHKDDQISSDSTKETLVNNDVTTNKNIYPDDDSNFGTTTEVPCENYEVNNATNEKNNTSITDSIVNGTPNTDKPSLGELEHLPTNPNPTLQNRSNSTQNDDTILSKQESIDQGEDRNKYLENGNNGNNDTSFQDFMNKIWSDITDIIFTFIISILKAFGFIN